MKRRKLPATQLTRLEMAGLIALQQKVRDAQAEMNTALSELGLLGKVFEIAPGGTVIERPAVEQNGAGVVNP